MAIMTKTIILFYLQYVSYFDYSAIINYFTTLKILLYGITFC